MDEYFILVKRCRHGTVHQWLHECHRTKSPPSDEITSRYPIQVRTHLCPLTPCPIIYADLTSFIAVAVPVPVTVNCTNGHTSPIGRKGHARTKPISSRFPVQVGTHLRLSNTPGKLTNDPKSVPHHVVLMGRTRTSDALRVLHETTLCMEWRNHEPCLLRQSSASNPKLIA